VFLKRLNVLVKLYHFFKVQAAIREKSVNLPSDYSVLVVAVDDGVCFCIVAKAMSNELPNGYGKSLFGIPQRFLV
jgi:hypothetical protein